MKKTTRIITIIAILLLQCTLLSGCGLIDDLRDHQAFYTGPENIDYKGNIYVKLPECEELQPMYDYWLTSPIYVTDNEVPVLLSAFYSHFQVYESKDDRFLVDGNVGVYCRQEMYNEMVSRINEGFKATKACYSYDMYNEDIGEYVTEYYVLTDEQLNAVKDIMKAEEASILPADAYMDYTHLVEIEFASDDLIFRKHLIDIYITDNNYYIHRYVDDGTTKVYTVPDNYKDIILDIMEKYFENGDYYYDIYDMEETL